MCGIFGVFGSHESSMNKEFIQCFESMKHRGPDNSDLVIKDNFMMGFHRLAIIDPEDLIGIFHQDEIYFTCNGEIYNYKHLIEKYELTCQTGSDCEVILQLYRKFGDLPNAIVDELDGVFAFILYDSKKDFTIIARDRIGVRPLYFGSSHNCTGFCLSSELKGNIFLGETCFQFPPGKILTVMHPDHSYGPIITRKELVSYIFYSKCQKYYNETFCISRYNSCASQKLIHDCLTEAVKKRLMSDRPIGFLVSGGLDSSLIASIANNLLPGPITTFSIGLKDSPDLIAARKVVKFLGSIHHEIIITSDDIINALEPTIRAIESYDTTTIRASIPGYLISKYISENTDIKVIFSGEGADELFGGYLYFHKAPGYSEFQAETERLIGELHYFDVLRSDRTTSAHGLELRVPFLDHDFTNLVVGLDPYLKMPGKQDEKMILRQAFDGFLPDSILYRQKNAFSDGVGKESVSRLKEYTESIGYTTPIDLLPEPRAYRTIYNSCGYSLHKPIPHYWMPKWVGTEITDPSATILDVFNEDLA